MRSAGLGIIGAARLTIAVILAATLTDCTGTPPSSPTPSLTPNPVPGGALVGAYDLVEVAAAPLGTSFEVGCGAPDTVGYAGTGSVRKGSLELRENRRFQLTFDFAFVCGPPPGGNVGAGTVLNTQGSMGAWTLGTGDPATPELTSDPGSPNGIIYQTRGRADGSLSLDVGIGTNRGVLVKTFVFRKQSAQAASRRLVA